MFIKGEVMSHYFLNDETLKHNKKEHKVEIASIPFTFLTDSGVFSKKGLDFGTRSLLETIPKVKGDVLDFGCGYGAIGIFLKKKFDCQVDMIDINERSLELAKENAKKNKVDVSIFKSNLYENVTKKYDYIISNPPIRVGKEILYQILFKAIEHLKDEGQFWFVIHKDQGAKTVLKNLQEKYNVTAIAKNKGFYIICVCNH